MSDSEQLYIPMEVNALVVNEALRNIDGFQRWEMNYNDLNRFESPEPQPSPDQNDYGNFENGVHLHWTLPAALRQCDLNESDANVQFPLVPNRWVVIRYSGKLNNRVATAWVVESDYLGQDGTSKYLEPYSKTLKPTSIGKKIALDGWSEQSKQQLHLTAMGTGNITFCIYQPYVKNVFSIHDPLEGCEDQETLSYMVAGWYSSPDKDILAEVTDIEQFNQLMNALNWEVANPDNNRDKLANKSIYHGLVTGVEWKKDGYSRSPKRPKLEDISFAIGDTSVDALTKLTQAHAHKQQKGDVHPLLLEALQYNMLPTLDEPNGKEQLYRAIHQAWFGSHHGGYSYVIVKNPDRQTEFDTDAATPDWLATLNQAQTDYDKAVRVLKQLQWKLYSLWISKGKLASLLDADNGEFPFTVAEFELELDSNKNDSLASLVVKQQQKVSDLRSKIPTGVDQQTLQASIKAYAAKHNLPIDYQLKQVSAEPFYMPNDPVVLISGIDTAGLLISDEPLTCRFKEDLVQGVTFEQQTIDAQALQNVIPLVDFSQLPQNIAALLTEFFFLDNNNAATIAKAVKGTTDTQVISKFQTVMAERKQNLGELPALNLNGWQQPWLPLFLEWKITYYPILFGDQEQGDWTFNGMKYDWNGSDKDTKPFTIQGRTFLTPNSSVNFRNRLQEFGQKYPDLSAEEIKNLDDFIDDTNHWRFLSQSMDGLTSQLALRSIEMNRIPDDDDSIKNLIGSQNSHIPILGSLPYKEDNWPSSNFQQFRSGQFVFESLTVVDIFGQILKLLTEENVNQVFPIIAPHMKPKKFVPKVTKERLLQLSPRLLQSARLNFDFIDAQQDGYPINLHSDVNPVCAWIVPNHINRGLNCFDNRGVALGELRTITNSYQERVVHWQSAPGSAYQEIDAIKDNFRHLGQFLNQLLLQGATVFDEFLKVIDETLWTIDPLGDRDNANLTVWVGRPLALTRARLQYELEAEPVWDPSWQYSLQQEAPDFINYNFPICLGDLVLRNDGLIGCFLDNDYDHFNLVNPPDNNQIDYLKPIGPKNHVNLHIKDAQQQFITMLIDPRAPVHATTDLLPTKTLQLPERYVNKALSNMELNVDVGPYLSNLEEPESTGHEQCSIFIPMPAERKTNWTWMNKQATDWHQYELKSTAQQADLAVDDSILRTGMLRRANK